MATADNKHCVFAIIGNIPHNHHSSDLRNYFSQFIETEGFDCFHFRHRPELKKPTKETEHVSMQSSRGDPIKTSCCIVRVKETRMSELLKSYHRKHWLDRKGESLPTLCMVSKIRVGKDSGTRSL